MPATDKIRIITWNVGGAKFLRQPEPERQETLGNLRRSRIPCAGQARGRARGREQPPPLSEVRVSDHVPLLADLPLCLPGRS